MSTARNNFHTHVQLNEATRAPGSQARLRNRPCGVPRFRDLVSHGLSLAFLLLATSLAQPRVRAGTPADTAPPSSGTDVSLRNEVHHALNRGLAWLQTSQNTNGFWSTSEHPAVTALALTAFAGDPSGRFHHLDPSQRDRGYTYILHCAQPDGGIYQTGLANYNTAVSMMALLVARQLEYEPILRKARQYLVSLQVDLGQPGKLDTPMDGGIGYDRTRKRADINNTLLALEALYYSRRLVEDSPSAAHDLDWKAAIHFIQSCQNLPVSNQEAWATDDPQNKGGFIYYPGNSMAGAVTNAATGRVAFRSYGSATYAGLLSYIYANLEKNDPRVIAVLDWLRHNYTVDENPGLGPQGLFYYLQTMTKALTLAGVDEFKLDGDKTANWSKEVALKLINLQQKDGSWANSNGRWWEKDSSLVTAYAVIALELIYRGL
jgi:squalene-hopene/tetraprenyl-beta-curcumene cyclase